MTKAKAIALMRQYDRGIVSPKFASEIAKAFGYKLKDLGFKSEKKYRLTNAPIPDNSLLHYTGIGICELANNLQIKLKKGNYIYSPFHGAGSSAEYITKEACNRLEK